MRLHLITHGNFGEHLFKHVSNPPEAFNEDVNFVANVASIYEDSSEHLFKHVSDPPEVSNDCVKIAAKDASVDKNVRKHLSKHVSDPPETKAITDVKLTKLAFPHKSDPPMVDAKKGYFGSN